MHTDSSFDEADETSVSISKHLKKEERRGSTEEPKSSILTDSVIEDTSLYYRLAPVESAEVSPEVIRREQNRKASLIDGADVDRYVYDLIQVRFL